jgi:hypothetical protein
MAVVDCELVVYAGYTLTVRESEGRRRPSHPKEAVRPTSHLEDMSRLVGDSRRAGKTLAWGQCPG